MEIYKFDYLNRGGLAKIYAFNLKAVRYLKRNYRTKGWYLKLWSNLPVDAFVIEIPVLAQGFSWNENSVFDEKGKFYEVSINGILPKCSADNEEIIQLLEHDKWLVLSQNNNGELRLSGSDDTLLIFRSGKSTGDAATSMNGNSFSFSGQTLQNSLYIEDFMLSDL